MSETMGRAYIGTSGWKKPQWRGDFYPKGLVQRRELEFASRQLSSLEINSTFHGLHKPSTFRGWRDETPDDFVFAVKGYETVARTALFRTAPVHLATFLASGMLELREKLGPIMWQLPDTAKFNAENVAGFLSLLPRTTDAAVELAGQAEGYAATSDPLPNRVLRHALEVRNASFLNTEFVDLLKQHNVAVVLSNAPTALAFTKPTADLVYVRLSSGEDHYADGYDDSTIEAWAARINGWQKSGHDVFAYFKNPAGVLPHTPHNAVRLLRMLAPDPD